jgi:hypothetical protein
MKKLSELLNEVSIFKLSIIWNPLDKHVSIRSCINKLGVAGFNS